MKINRVWAMPNKWTFTIKPIKQLIDYYVGRGDNWIDPFAGKYSPAEFTNDLNPERQATEHKDALIFLQSWQNAAKFRGCIYDPPYSFSEAVKCYKSFGKDNFNTGSMQYWANCKNMVAGIIKPEGLIICCGWNSNGLGINRGFEMIEILLVAHGGSKNDTIVTVERKTK